MRNKEFLEKRCLHTLFLISKKDPMKFKFLLFLTTALPIFLLDQLTKMSIIQNVKLGQTIEIFPHFFDIVHYTNKGAAFGVFSSLPDILRVPLFYILSTAATLVVLYFLIHLPIAKKGLLLSLNFILGGAMGNLFDRIFRGEVVDFLSLHWYNQWATWTLWQWQWRFKLEWPAFNVADMAISTATVLLMILILKGEDFSSSVKGPPAKGD